MQRGLYVAPSGTTSEWHGVLYVTGGPYDGGVFVFKVLIPRSVHACAAEWPARMPAREWPRGKGGVCGLRATTTLQHLICPPDVPGATRRTGQPFVS